MGHLDHTTRSHVNLGVGGTNEWYLTGIQLEVGEKATPFEHRSYGDELISANDITNVNRAPGYQRPFQCTGRYLHGLCVFKSRCRNACSTDNNDTIGNFQALDSGGRTITDIVHSTGTDECTVLRIDSSSQFTTTHNFILWSNTEVLGSNLTRSFKP